MIRQKKASLSYRVADAIVDYRHALIGLVVVATIFMAMNIPGLAGDPSLRSMLVTSSPAYAQYEDFVEVFGDQEFVLVAIKNQLKAGDQTVLSALKAMTDELGNVEEIAEVLSLTNLRFFQKRGDKFGVFPVVRATNGALQFPEQSDFDRMRAALPLMRFLVSEDLKTVGVLIRVHERWKYDAGTIDRLLADIRKVIARHSPAGSDYRITGPAILRQAVSGYSIRAALVFGFLCMLICTSVTMYVFKSAKVTAIAFLILCTCVVWVLGLMSLMKIPLNPTTSMSFGMILITTLEIVIHVITRYHQFHESEPDRTRAVKQMVSYLVRPCLMCSLTTAVGFATCMVTSIPMVFQLGMIMPLGLMVSYCLAMVLTPAFVIASTSQQFQTTRTTGENLLSKAIEAVKQSIAHSHRLYTVAGLGVGIIMFAGVPWITTDPQILRQLGRNSPEVRDVAFVEENLTSVHSVELVLKSEDQSFRTPQLWKKVQELQKRLGELGEVVSTESFLSVLKYLDDMIGGPTSGNQDLFSHPGRISELLMMASLSPEGRAIRARYLNDESDQLHVTIRVKNSPSTPIGETIEDIRRTARSVMDGLAEVVVTGELEVVASQGEELIWSEFVSMFLAVVIIVVLMMIQMGTPMFGLLSLVPNIPPLATVFGIMGWAGISLNGVTIFAANVALGLSVDNTIQYVAQLKREIRLNPHLGVEQCVLRAYSLAARPMASWSIVTMLGFLALASTPFRGAVDFGVLVASAVFMGMFGDLVFMQSVILTFPSVRRLITRVIEKEIAVQGR